MFLFKRAQIKMGESVGILVIFFLLLVFGFSFFGKVSQSSLAKSEQEAFELKSVNVAQMFLFLPELQCTEQESVDVDCIDIYKMNELLKLTSTKPDGTGAFPGYDEKTRLYYFNLFGSAKVTLVQVYPDPGLDPFITNNGFTLYTDGSRPFYGNLATKYTKKLATNIPVSIYNPLRNTYAFGYLKVEVTS